MSTFRYTRVTYRDGKIVHQEQVEISSTDLYLLRKASNRQAFLEQINIWNKLGMPKSEAVNMYVYYAESDLI